MKNRPKAAWEGWTERLWSRYKLTKMELEMTDLKSASSSDLLNELLHLRDGNPVEAKMDDDAFYESKVLKPMDPPFNLSRVQAEILAAAAMWNPPSDGKKDAQ